MIDGRTRGQQGPIQVTGSDPYDLDRFSRSSGSELDDPHAVKLREVSSVRGQHDLIVRECENCSKKTVNLKIHCISVKNSEIQ